MLNRVGNGAAVAALPLAAAIAASAQGCSLLAEIFGALTVVVLLIACAPWLPVVRTTLPSARRADAIERLLVEGSRLAARDITSDGELQTWKADWERWQQDVLSELSPVDAERVIHPRVVAHDVGGSFNREHSRGRNILGHQVRALEDVLERVPAWARSL